MGLERRFLEVLFVFPEDLDLVPSTHIRRMSWRAPEPWLSTAPSPYFFGNQLLGGKIKELKLCVKCFKLTSQSLLPLPHTLSAVKNIWILLSMI